MADQTRAAELPDQSVVADGRVAYIKNHPSKTAQWRGTNGGYFGDWAVDEVLASGGQVLRVGGGTEGDRGCSAAGAAT